MTRRPLPKPDIQEVLEHYGGQVIGGDRGGWRKAKCPIHEDRTPSASVNTDDCRFHCHVCDFSGDAVDLIREIENVGWARAIEIAQGFPGGGDDDVREERGRSSLLPSGSRNRPRGSVRPAPWTRL